jgi:hypothetical protein
MQNAEEERKVVLEMSSTDVENNIDNTEIIVNY